MKVVLAIVPFSINSHVIKIHLQLFYSIIKKIVTELGVNDQNGCMKVFNFCSHQTNYCFILCIDAIDISIFSQLGCEELFIPLNLGSYYS